MVSLDGSQLNGHLRNEIKEAFREVLTEEQDRKIQYMNERLDELEEAIEEFPEMKKSINELDELLKGLNRSNKEILYRISKNDLLNRQK